MDKILILDDDKGARFFIKEALAPLPYKLFFASNTTRAEEILSSEGDIKVIVTDVRMPSEDGISFLERILPLYPDLVPVVITAYKDERLDIDGLNGIAASFLIKPFSPEKIRAEIQRAIAKCESSKNSRKLEGFPFLIGEDPRIQEVKEIIRKVADSKVTVLIEGESGTGKELVARAIHNLGPRRRQPFMAISCSAIPDTLLESELFGYEKGAFTGADISKPGKFEVAQEGTIFLDEIGDMSLVLQAKLLRVLEERRVERLGGIKPVKIKARIIAATNKDLRQEVEKGSFRRDLYYRLNVILLKLPPLRQRKNDIPLLVEHFINKFNPQFGKNIKQISVETMEIFLNYAWPGNIRELENVIQRSLVLEKEAVLTKESLPLYLRKNAGPASAEIEASPDSSPPPLSAIIKATVEKVEKKVLSEYLRKFGGNKTKVAAVLGLSRRALYNKLRKYHLEK